MTGRATAVQDGEGGGPGSGPEPSAAADGDGSPRAGQAARPEVFTAGAVEGAFAAAPPRVLHLTGITPALSATARTAADRAVQLARRSGALVCLDVNFRSRLWTAEEAASVLSEWMPFVDILIASEDELPLCLPGGGGRSGGAQKTPGVEGTQETPGARGMQETPGAGGASARAGGASAGAGGASAGPGAAGGEALVADQAGRLLDGGVREVVVKLGAAGATVHTGDGTLHQPAPSVRAVDAVGAGDAFVAGYLSALLDGAGPAGRLERATTTGAFAVASPGDWEGAPTRAELGMLGSPPGTVVR